MLFRILQRDIFKITSQKYTQTENENHTFPDKQQEKDV